MLWPRPYSQANEASPVGRSDLDGQTSGPDDPDLAAGQNEPVGDSSSDEDNFARNGVVHNSPRRRRTRSREPQVRGAASTPNAKGNSLTIIDALVAMNATRRVFVPASLARLVFLFLQTNYLAWNPDRPEVLAIARHILSDALTSPQFTWLAKRTPTWTVAHYGQLKSAIQERAVEQLYGSGSPKECLRAAMRNGHAAKPIAGSIPWGILESAFDDVERSSSAAHSDYVTVVNEETT
ncbi:MAG: hypothetical protein KAY37_11650 [Phycisphaerae bacterium]|nr:hypothetical protein [Phycisphaerae bacterium]